MKRYTFIMFFISICALILLGCNQTHEEEKAVLSNSVYDFNQTKINFIGLWKERDSKRNLVNSVVRKFELEHQKFKVDFQFKEDIVEEYGEKYIVEDSIITMVKTGDYPWDIVSLTRNSYKLIADELQDPEWGKKYLVNFEEFDWFKANHIARIFNVSDYRDGFGGIIAGPMVEGQIYGLWFNVETAKKLGITIKQREMTFEDLVGYCQRVAEYNQTASEPITVFPNFKLQYQVHILFNSLVLSEIGDAKGELPEPSAVKHAIMKSLSALEQLSAYDVVNTNVVVEEEAVRSLSGHVLFAIKASYWYNKCETADQEKAPNMVPAELPVFEYSAPIYFGTYQSVWAVFKDAPHKEEAIELMKYFTTNDVAERWLSTTFNPTGLKVKLRASDFGQNEIEKFNTHIDTKYGENLINYELGEVLWGKKGISIDPQKVLTGELSAQEFYNELLSKL